MTERVIYVAYKNDPQKRIKSVSLAFALKSQWRSREKAESVFRSDEILVTKSSYYCASRRKLADYLKKNWG